jgi:hypothetical protein
MKYSKFIDNWYLYSRARLALWCAKKKADKLHKLTGRRYHVLRTNDRYGFTCIDNEIARRKNIKYMDILKNSLYSTSVQGLTRRTTLN